MDSVLQQYPFHLGVRPAVLLEFDNHGVFQVRVQAGRKIMEMQIEVYRQSLGLRGVHKGDSVELCRTFRENAVRLEPRLPGQKISRRLVSREIHTLIDRKWDPLLFGPSVILFALYLEIGIARNKICTHTHFLTRLAPRFMGSVHEQVRSIVVD